MRNTMEKITIIGSIVIILVWVCTGCTYMDRWFKKEPATEPEPVSSVRSEPAPSVRSEPAPSVQSEPVPPSKAEQEATVKTEPSISAEESKPLPPKKAKIDIPPKPAYYEHKVRWSGENLSVISKWYTGKSRNWEAIADFNPKINPNRIFIGNKILIPKDLLKTSQPMPRDFISQFFRKPKRKTSSTKPALSSTSPEEKEETELFGPKEYRSK